MKQKAPRDEGEASLGEVLEFMRLLWALHHAMQSTSKRMSRRIGLTGPQRLVLRVLMKRPGMTAGELARALHTDPSTLTGVLARLESRRLLKKEVDENDARRLRLSLTAEGRKEGRERSGTVESAVRDALQSLSPEALRHARKALQLISERMAAVED